MENVINRVAFVFVSVNATLFSMVLAGRPPFVERKVPSLFMQRVGSIENKVASTLKRLVATHF